MRKLTTLLLAVAISMAGVFGVAAQDADDAVGASGGGSDVFYDDRGNQIATLNVTDVEAGWSDYEENRGPARGYDYHAVHFTVTNDSDAVLEITPARFSLVDNLGMNNSRSHVRVADEMTSSVLTDDVDLEVGETLDATVIYELFSDVSPVLFMWQPDGGSLVLVDVADGSVEESAVATGLNAPAFFGDDRGNVVGSIEVLEVEDAWQDFSEYNSPDRGMRHVAVHFEVTNLSDAPIEVTPFNVSLLDSESTNNGRSYASAAETAEVQVTSDAENVAPGESFQGMLVYTLYEGVDPAALIWQPDYGVITAVMLEEADQESVTEATPEDDDEVDEVDVVASPAA